LAKKQGLDENLIGCLETYRTHLNLSRTIRNNFNNQVNFILFLFTLDIEIKRK
jgi:hypothetical protein